MVVQAGEDPAGGGVVLQIPQHLVHLVHVPLGIVVLHPQLIAVCLSDGARLIRPGVPDMAVQVMDIVGLLLPDPQQLVHRGSQILLPHGDDRELLPQVIAVDYPKELHRVGGRPILPAGPDLPVRVPDAPAQDRSAILNKNLIGITHALCSCFLILSSLYNREGRGTSPALRLSRSPVYPSWRI